MTYYLAIRRMTRPFTEWQDRLDEHLDWLHAQHDNGTILISGPSADRSLGLYVMRATSATAATTVVSADPLSHDGMATIEVIEWDIHQIIGIGPFTLDAVHTVEQRRA